jgi:hypothetical protein
MAGFELARGTRIQAPPARVHALLDDFREWRRWSPWEGVDPALRREYSGPAQGVGATYHWSGNRKAGEGEMRIIESTPHAVVVDLRFLKPFKATNVTTFTLAPVAAAAGGAAEATDVTWTMAGTRSAVMSAMGRLFFDKAIAADFEKGLASLKQEAEQV